MVLHNESHWYAFVTRPRHEKKAKQYLDAAGFQAYLPIHKTLRQWKDRSRWVLAPLLPGFIFVYLPYRNRYDVLQQPSMVRVVSINNQPCPVRQAELDALKYFISQEIDIKIHDGLLTGDKVKVESGILMGYEGQITERRGEYYFVIFMDAINKSICVNAKDVQLKKINEFA